MGGPDVGARTPRGVAGGPSTEEHGAPADRHQRAVRDGVWRRAGGPDRRHRWGPVPPVRDPGVGRAGHHHPVVPERLLYPVSRPLGGIRLERRRLADGPPRTGGRLPPGERRPGAGGRVNDLRARPGLLGGPGPSAAGGRRRTSTRGHPLWQPRDRRRAVGRRLQQLTVFNQFLIQPLVFFGGVFYPISDLPGLMETVSYLNPMVYIVSGIRFGLLGQAEVSPVVSLGVLAGASVVAVAAVLALMARGYGLRS